MTGLALAVLALAVLACASPPMPDGSGPAQTATVAATWAADDGSLVVLNVVVAPRTRLDELPQIARDVRARHPASRVIVQVFASAAGPERFVIGHVPSGAEPLAAGRRPPSLIATYDFPPTPER